MRKISTTLVIMLLACTSLMAQKKKKWGHFGLKTGFNISTLALDDDAGIDNSWKSGFVLGAFVKIPVSAKFAIQPEFLYSSMGGDLEQGLNNDNYRINYFSIPILGKIDLSKKFTAVVGPQLDFLIQGKYNKETVNTNDLAEFGFAGTAGAEYWPLPSLGFTLRYIYGFTNVLNEDKFNDKWKTHGAQLTVNFKLN